MYGLRSSSRRSGKDEAEKPFWISFSDLMTALMVLFLVAMAVALISITQQTLSGPEELDRQIGACMADVAEMTAAEFPGVEIRDRSIGFGTLALFGRDKHVLDTSSEKIIRSYVPRILNLARSIKCGSVFKRVTVEGFASRSGTYIYNLNLSLQRAERVLCVLLDPSVKDALTEDDRKFVRSLFLVGGSSFNAFKESEAESQRIELRLEFFTYVDFVNDKKDKSDKKDKISDLPLDPAMQCPL